MPRFPGPQNGCRLAHSGHAVDCQGMGSSSIGRSSTRGVCRSTRKSRLPPRCVSRAQPRIVLASPFSVENGLPRCDWLNLTYYFTYFYLIIIVMRCFSTTYLSKQAATHLVLFAERAHALIGRVVIAKPVMRSVSGPMLRSFRIGKNNRRTLRRLAGEVSVHMPHGKHYWHLRHLRTRYGHEKRVWGLFMGMGQ